MDDYELDTLIETARAAVKAWQASEYSQVAWEDESELSEAMDALETALEGVY